MAVKTECVCVQFCWKFCFQILLNEPIFLEVSPHLARSPIEERLVIADVSEIL